MQIANATGFPEQKAGFHARFPGLL